ncbi:unnamed protein product [Prunus armeniaca]
MSLIDPYLSRVNMNPPSSFTPDGFILSHAPHPSRRGRRHPCKKALLKPTLVQIESLWQDMAKMQDHTNILSSKLDDTQRQLYEQQTHSA